MQATAVEASSSSCFYAWSWFEDNLMTSLFIVSIRFQNRRMKLKKEIQAIKELNEQEKQAQAQKAALAAQGHSIEGN